MSEPIRMGLFGLGAVAHYSANAIRLCGGMTPYACAAHDSLERAEQFAAEYGFEKAYGTYEELLADPQVELVYIAVPHALHYDCAMKCLNAGKSVLVEKPFAANARQAQEMISLAREKGLFCAEGIWSRYVPAAEKLKELASSGMIGEIGMVTGELGMHMTQERLFDPAMAGGALLDVGIYTLALADLFFDAPVETVTANAVLTDRGVDETTSFTLRYANGAMAAMNVSMKCANRRRGTVWGTKGYAEIDDTNFLNGFTVYDNEGKELASFSNPPAENGYLPEMEAAARDFRAGYPDTAECPHEQVLRRIQTMDRIRREIGLVYPFE